jgi:hypothetical protein
MKSNSLVQQRAEPELVYPVPTLIRSQVEGTLVTCVVVGGGMLIVPLLHSGRTNST